MKPYRAAHYAFALAGMMTIGATTANAGDFLTWFGLKPIGVHAASAHDRSDDGQRRGRGTDDGAGHDAGDDHGGDRHREAGDDKGGRGRGGDDRGGDDHGRHGGGHD